MRMTVALLAAAVLAAQNGIEPIHLDPSNHQYFSYRGRTIVLVTSSEHYGAVINADFDGTKYLETLQKDGLNETRLFGGSYVEVPGESFGIRRNTLAPAPGKLILPWARSQEPGYAGGGNRFDLDRWDDRYFQRLRDYLRAAEERGIIVELTLFSSQYGDAQWNMSVFNAPNNVNHTDPVSWKNVNTLDNGNLLAYQERYTRKLVREANAFPNVIFEIQNEPWSDRGQLADVINPYLALPGRNLYPNSVDLADAQSLAWQERVAGWITDEESRLPNRHLIAQNFCNFRFAVGEPVRGASVLNFHYAYPEAATLNYGIDKPLTYDETGFLGQTDAGYRRQAWNFLLSGGAVFDALDYSFSPGHEDGSDTEPNGPGGGGATLRKQLGILHRFVDSVPLAEMKPDATTVVHAEGVQIRMLSSARVHIAYVDGNGPARIRLRLGVGDYLGFWEDTETGARTVIPEFRSRGDESVLETPAFRQGLALLLFRKGAARLTVQGENPR